MSTRSRVRDSGVARGSAGIIAVEPRVLGSFDLGEPLLRGVDHLPEAPQDVRVEDRPLRAAIARDLGLQLL